MGLPPILYVRDLRRLLEGWNADRVRHYLKANGLGLQDACGDWYTTTTMLGDKVPEALRAMEAKWTAISTHKQFDPDDFADLD